MLSPGHALLLLLWFPSLQAQAPSVPPPSTAPRNAFAGVETIVLENGLKVWFKRMPGEPNVSVNFSVAAGADQEPAGKEQLAHFLEHMLFADHLGKSTLEIGRELTDRGGTTNGFTSWDRTAYFVNIDKAHALLAIDWLGRVASPHAMDSAVVAREREPVAVEVRGVRRKPLDWFAALYLDPPWLRLPDFWEREFGIAPARAVGDVDFYRSLQRIGPADLREFYDRWYTPDRMTLMIAGDVDRDAAIAEARKTFGALVSRPAAPFTDSIHDPGRGRKAYAWVPRASVGYSDRYRVYQRSAADDVRLEFVAAFLGQRLNDRLRFGERKAAYGVSASVTRRGRAAMLQVSANIKESEFDWARSVIDEEIAALVSGSHSDSVYAAERSAVARTLRVQTATARAVANWAINTFTDPRIHRDFPDVVSAFESMPRAEVGAFARGLFEPGRRSVQVIAPLPLPQAVIAGLAVLILAATIALARWILWRPLDMTRLRYVARFKVPLVYRLVLVPLLIVLLAVGLRLLVYGYMVVADRWLTMAPSFAVQWSIYAVFAAFAALLVIAALARWPRKLLVLDDALVVKYLSYRAVTLGAADIAEIAPLRFRDVWLSRRLWRCTPLALGLSRPAIYLRQVDGRAWFFGVRDTAECLGVLARLQARPVAPTP